MHKLIIFDIDGTLTATTDVDSDCYTRAISDHLGSPVDTDWASYRHVTDAGIATELLTKHGRPIEELAAVKERFVTLLMRALHESPSCCAQIPGASTLLLSLRQMPRLTIGVATGGWCTSAMAKLRFAAIDIAGLAFASSDDALSRIDIMKTCHDRAAANARTITEITYLGDGVWDAKASEALGWRFIGVGAGASAERLRSAGVRTILADYRDIAAFWKAAELR
jgi:phosphoglycolate phosphatase-like HAD superfamily hydrolase